MQKGVRTALRVIVLLLTVLEGLGMPAAGTGKFWNHFWRDGFVIWGYPMWFMYGIGAVETIAGLALFVPRLAAWAALVLIAIMLGAVATTVHHPIVQPRFTWVTPAFHICVLTTIAAWRWKDRWRR